MMYECDSKSKTGRRTSCADGVFHALRRRAVLQAPHERGRRAWESANRVRRVEG